MEWVPVDLLPIGSVLTGSYRQRDLLLEVTNDEFTFVKCCQLWLDLSQSSSFKGPPWFLLSNGILPSGSRESASSGSTTDEEFFCRETEAVGVRRFITNTP